MNHSLVKFVISNVALATALGAASTSAFAAGSLQPLVAAPTGSAYINCYNAGRVVPPLAGPQESTLNARSNFGNTALGGSSGVCEITGLANDATAPLPGYGLQVTSTTQNITNPGGTVIGNVTERVWRKPAATAPVTPTNMCIIGTKVTLSTNARYDNYYFELNDIARGGYSSYGTVNVGYFTLSSTPALSPVYRVGRTFTSVQHRAYKYGFGSTFAERQNNATGYLDLPLIAGLTTTAINGNPVGVGPGVVAPTAASNTQQAQVNSNWVDFTLDAYYFDEDDSTNPVSAMTYIQFPCNADTLAVMNSVAPSGSTLGWRKAGALRLRRTGQEFSTFAEIVMTGYAPPGATIP